MCKWSPSGRKVVSGGARGEVIVWDALLGIRMAFLKGEHDAPEGLAFSPDSSMIFCYDRQKIQVGTFKFLDSEGCRNPAHSKISTLHDSRYMGGSLSGIFSEVGRQ